ncbi:mCG1044750, isoform CRA_a, partial [Mus musculus]
DLSSKNKRHGEVYCWQQTRSKLGTIQSSVSLGKHSGSLAFLFSFGARTEETSVCKALPAAESPCPPVLSDSDRMMKMTQRG